MGRPVVEALSRPMIKLFHCKCKIGFSDLSEIRSFWEVLLFSITWVLSKLVCLAYSMGGWPAFALAAYFSERVASLVIGGAHPFQESFDDFTSVDGSNPDAFIHALSSFIGEKIAPEFHPIILQNDLVALSAAAQNRQSCVGQGTEPAR